MGPRFSSITIVAIVQVQYFVLWVRLMFCAGILERKTKKQCSLVHSHNRKNGSIADFDFGIGRGVIRLHRSS